MHLRLLPCSIFEDGRPVLLWPPKPVTRPWTVRADVRPSGTGWRLPGKQQEREQQKGALGGAPLWGHGVPRSLQRSVDVLPRLQSPFSSSFMSPSPRPCEDTIHDNEPLLSSFSVPPPFSCGWGLWCPVYSRGYHDSDKVIHCSRPNNQVAGEAARASGSKLRSPSTRFHQTHSPGRNPGNRRRGQERGGLLVRWRWLFGDRTSLLVTLF